MFEELHKILLGDGVRGANRALGEFRMIQNFIGPKGCTIETASFVPPPPQRVDEYMSNLDNYINEPTDSLHPLVRIAIIHAQCETIHPFLDGNGRIGRILIPLYLFDQKVSDSPNLFISETLEKDKHKYYDYPTKSSRTRACIPYKILNWRGHYFIWYASATKILFVG